MSPIALRSRSTSILIIIIIALGVEIIYLVFQNQKLRDIISDPKRYSKVLSPGEMVPSFSAYDIDGDDISLRYSPEAPKTILFWFAPGCEPCNGNIGFWTEIYNEYYSAEEFRFLGLCPGIPDDVSEYVNEYGIGFPVICVTDRYIAEAYQGHVLPQTVLISPQGATIKVWPGALEEKDKDEILSYLAKPQSLIYSEGGES